MATITRTEAIEQIQEVLKAYENKIRDIRFDTEKLSPEGKNIVDSYCSNEENEQVLVRKAYSDKKFFKKVNETQLGKATVNAINSLSRTQGNVDLRL